MKVIGHRGAAGLALENTLSSLELAKLLGVDAIEFDVRMTKDRELVLCHDATLDRISDSNARLNDFTLKELQKITLRDGVSTIPTLKEALKAIDGTPVFIEIKVNDCEKELLEIINEFPNLDVTIVSFKIEVLALLREMRPDLRLYVNEQTKPFDIIHIAKRLRLDGVGLNFWLLNPLTYYMAKREQLDIFVFTMNSRIVGKFIQWLYPTVAVCSNHPEWFLKHPYPIVRTLEKVRTDHQKSLSKVKRVKLKKAK